MRPGFTTKLLLLLLLTAALLVAGMGLATRWSFQRGFADYLGQAELQRLDPMVAPLLATYREQGSWRFLWRNRTGWVYFLSFLPGAPNPGSAAPPLPSAPGVLPPGPTSGWVGHRLRIIDARERLVVGPPMDQKQGPRRALEVDGETVGWLVLTPMSLPEDELAQRFQEEQLATLLPIGAGVFTLMVLIALPFGRHLLRPVKAVTRGARQLAAGRYESRIEVTGHDEIGRLAADFNLLAEALERNEALRRRGMADVSHELRTPLSLLRAEIEALQDGVRPCDGERLASLHDTTLRLGRLVDDLYDLALADAGALDYRKEEIDLGNLAAEALRGAEEGFRAKGLGLEGALPDTPLPLLADPRRLRQVFDNLLKNSLRYSDPGTTTHLSVRREGHEAVVTLEDGPPGVEPEALARLFERFYRTEASRNRATGGAGLGLAICRSIVEAHAGTIGAEASPLGGVRVSVRLPLA